MMKISELIEKLPDVGPNSMDVDSLLYELDEAAEEGRDDMATKTAIITRHIKWAIERALREFAPVTIVPDPYPDEE